MALPEQEDGITVEQFKFSGIAGEWFGIYIVNNIFTWLTLGIYSAWAKVRTLQYFYGNTELAGGRFQFTASPLKILRGRIIAVLLLILYFAAENIQSDLANIVLFSFIAAFFILSPVLTVLVMSFKLRYSEWRGISFSFNRNFREAYRVYLIPTAVTALFLASFAAPLNSTEIEEFFGYESPVYQSETDSIDEDDEVYDDESTVAEGEADVSGELISDEFVEESDDYSYDDEYAYSDDEAEEDRYMNPYFFIPSGILGLLILLLMPYFDFINIRFMARNARLGKAHFNYIATVRDYYIVYAKWFVAALLLAGLWGMEFLYDFFDSLGLMWGLIGVTLLAIPATRAYFKSQRYNLLLGKTAVDGKHQLNADTTFLGLFWLMVSNTVVIILTLGLMKPWAQIRTARYLLEHSSVDVNGSLDDFVAQQEPEMNATMEEVADIFDLDILG